MVRFCRPLSLALVLCYAIAAAAQDPKIIFPDSGTTSLPFKVADNLVLVNVELNGKTGLFIFDTGAESTVVNTIFAKKAGLRSRGTTVGTGSAGSATAGIIRETKLRVGTITADDLTVYSLPIEPFKYALGYHIDGILGNDVIAKTVAEIDYARMTLKMYRPDVFTAPSRAVMLSLSIDDNEPFVNATVVVSPTRSITAKMEIDTGSTGVLLLNSPFVRKHGLTAAMPAGMAAKTGGVGGTGASKLGRFTGIRLDDVTLMDPLVQLYTGTKGDNANPKYDGLLGGAVFRRFKMTVDMPGRRLFLEPNDTVGDAFDTDMSGIELNASGEDLTTIDIDEVKPASVAAKAGIRGGERIRSVNGRPATELGLQEIRRILRTAGEVDLELERGRRVFTVHLVLKRVI